MSFRSRLYSLLWLFGLLSLALGGVVRAQGEPGTVYRAEIRGIINPPAANYLTRVLDAAAADGAALVVLELDTPGGLDSSMREMIQAILASPVPVVTYVSPSGSRAASAGLFILVASHVAAMAPGTNTGAAHPVGLGGEADETSTAKVVHDAAATIRSLAERQNRNAEWVERAVRESVSVTAQEALELNVIDLVVPSFEHLLRELDGTQVETVAGVVELQVSDAPQRTMSMNFAERFLHTISDPNIAFILLSVGSIGIIAELYNPGVLIPGITGVISLILAFFALGNLPTNWAGAALIGLAGVLLVAELQTDSTGVLAVGGLVAFVLGGLLLFRPLQTGSPALPDLRVSPWLLGGTLVFMLAFFFLVIGQLIRARFAPLQTGQERFIGQMVQVRQDLNPRGRVWFQGQAWFAQTAGGQEVEAGRIVRIVGMDGLTLLVEPVEVEHAPNGDG